jgi:hypothetical protein
MKLFCLPVGKQDFHLEVNHDSVLKLPCSLSFHSRHGFPSVWICFAADAGQSLYAVTTDNRLLQFMHYSRLNKKSSRGECGQSQIVSVNLTSGAATSLGFIGSDNPIRGLAATAP